MLTAGGIGGMDRGWLDHFEAFSAFHGVVVGACVLVIVAACAVGRGLRRLDRLDRGGRGGREARFAAGMGWTIAGWQAFATVWRVLPGQWDLNESLPFHLCRWTAWIAAACLIAGERAGWRWTRAVMFFWGLGLSVQGFITPMWSFGAGSVDFWLYWLAHLQIVGVAVYDLAVRGFVPRGRDLGVAAGLGVAFVVLVAGVNAGLGTNYSYLGSWDYEKASVVDRLGPYPERVFKMAGGALVLFVVMYLVARGVAWGAARRWTRGSGGVAA